MAAAAGILAGGGETEAPSLRHDAAAATATGEEEEGGRCGVSGLLEPLP